MTEHNSAASTSPATTAAGGGSTRASDAAASRASMSWRVVDIVTCAVIGVAFGVLFLVWNITGATFAKALDGVIPGLSGLLLGVWMLAGLVGAFIVRKPGAALIAEVIAAIVEMVAGSQWGLGGLMSGIVQGLGIEIVVASFAYRRWGLKTALLAGGIAAMLEWGLELFLYNAAATLPFKIGYLVFCVVSGVLLCGLLGWLIVKALARTGALNQFAAGREARGQID